MKNFEADGIVIRRKRTFKDLKAYLYTNQHWFKLGTIVLKEETGDYIRCLSPEAFRKSYKSSDPYYKEFIMKAQELYEK